MVKASYMFRQIFTAYLSDSSTSAPFIAVLTSLYQLWVNALRYISLRVFAPVWRLTRNCEMIIAQLPVFFIHLQRTFQMHIRLLF